MFLPTLEQEAQMSRKQRSRGNTPNKRLTDLSGVKASEAERIRGGEATTDLRGLVSKVEENRQQKEQVRIAQT